MEFLTDWGVVIALVCAGAAVVYGVTTSRWLLALSPGNQEMQDISKAVQEGADAYLNRQFKTLAPFAVLIFAVLFVLPAESTGTRIGRSVFFLIVRIIRRISAYGLRLRFPKKRKLTVILFT